MAESDAKDAAGAQFSGGVGEGAGDFIGWIISEIANAPTYAEAEKLRQQAMAEYNIALPPVQQMQAQAVRSQAATAQGDNAAKAARSRALQLLSERADEGYNAEDRAAVNETMMDVGLAERGRREALLRQLSPNSGAAVAARLSSAQHAANQANQRGLDIAGQSRRNAMNAIAASGDLAGDIDTSEFGQSYNRGQAQDAISRFNEGNRIDVGQWNAAQQQQQFQNQMRLADAKSEGYRTRAGDKDREAERRMRAFRAGGRVVGKIGGLAAGIG